MGDRALGDAVPEAGEGRPEVGDREEVRERSEPVVGPVLPVVVAAAAAEAAEAAVALAEPVGEVTSNMPMVERRGSTST